jgi:hypothetical protein
VPVESEAPALECPQWFVDFEASGIAPDSYRSEISMVSADFDYQALIRPLCYWTHWSFDAQDTHGISRQNLPANGLEPSLIPAALNATYEGARLCADSLQDGFWLDTLYEAAGIQPSFELLPIHRRCVTHLWA